MTHSWVEIDLGALKENVQSLRRSIPADVEIIFVVKADAYNHGIIPVSCAAAEAGVKWLAVAYLDEALKIRAALPDVNILILGVLDSGDVATAHRNHIIPILANGDHARALAAEAARLGIELPVHLKIDTGMGRLGCPWNGVEALAAELKKFPALKISGACSHFAAVEPDSPHGAKMQVERFETALHFLPENIFKHISSSRAALFFPEWDFSGIRQGIVLYGYGTGHPDGRFHTRPILQWKTRIVQIKQVPAGYAVGYVSTHVTENPTQIATLAVGYADGYNRALSNRGDVLIHGRRCAVVGRVSMNWVTVDLGPDLAAQTGDEAVLIGRQGGEEIWASELSKICRTIPYEILTSINAGIERRYIQ